MAIYINKWPKWFPFGVLSSNQSFTDWIGVFFNLSRKTVNQFEGQVWEVHGNFTWQTKMKYIRARCFETFRKDKKCYMFRLYTLMNMSIFILSFLFSQQEWTVSEVNTVFSMYIDSFLKDTLVIIILYLYMYINVLVCVSKLT